MRLLIAVGGGGHFSPALAVIKQLPTDWEILLVGRKHTFEGDSALSLEYQTAQRLGLPFRALTTGRLQRKLSKRSFTSLAKVPVGLAQSFKILREFKPDVVLSFGGYVAVPLSIAAKSMRIPIVVHEQTLQAGLANKIVARFAEKICVSWKESEKYFPRHKVVYTGNPIRLDFVKQGVTVPSAAARPTLYITGGSGGAHGINILVQSCLEKLLEKYYVIHQTGDSQEYKDYDKLSKDVLSLPESLQKRYMLKKFIRPEDVVQLMCAADLVVSRAGINTLTELLYLGKPCLLIPLPYGQRNEQSKNALFVERVGMGKAVEQSTLHAQDFYETINDMILHIAYYRDHAQDARALIPVDAAQKIISVVHHVNQNKS